jgi:hypothetical protein
MIESVNRIENLPVWAKFLVNCGAWMQTHETRVTLVLTLPRREFAAGLVSLGAVLQAEETAWNQTFSNLPASKTLNAADIVVGNRYQLLSVKRNLIRYGIVHNFDEDAESITYGFPMRVLNANPWHKVTSNANDICLDESPYLGNPNPKQLENFLPQIHSLFNNDRRTCTFCSINSTTTCIIGVDSRVKKELQNLQISTPDGNCPLSQLTRMEFPQQAQQRNSRSIFINQRTKPTQQTLERIQSSLLVLDSPIAWRRWQPKTNNLVRVLIMDRSLSSFEADLSNVNTSIEADPCPLPNDLVPPRGIEVFAYKPLVGA